eukprot:6608435-Ditylum_brightwellii.AAC.1
MRHTNQQFKHNNHKEHSSEVDGIDGECKKKSTTTANYKTTECKGSNYNHGNDNNNDNVDEEYNISEEEEKED